MPLLDCPLGASLFWLRRIFHPVLVPSRSIRHARLCIPLHDVPCGRVINTYLFAGPKHGPAGFRDYFDQLHALLRSRFLVWTALLDF